MILERNGRKQWDRGKGEGESEGILCEGIFISERIRKKIDEEKQCVYLRGEIVAAMDGWMNRARGDRRHVHNNKNTNSSSERASERARSITHSIEAHNDEVHGA